MARLSLKSRVVTATALVVAAFTILLVLVARHYAYTNLKALLQAQQDTQVRLVAEELDDRLQVHATLLRRLAKRLSSIPNQNPAIPQHVIRQTLVAPEIFDRVFLVQPDGKIVFDTQPSTPHTDYPNQAYFREITDGASLAISQPQKITPNSGPEAIMAVPVRAANGQLRAILAASLSLQRGNSLGALSQHRNGKASVYCLVSADQSSHDVTQVDGSRAHQQTKAANEACGLPLSGAAWNFTGLTQPIVARYPVKTAGWELLSALPANEAFSPLTGTRPKILMTAIVALIGAVLLMWLLVRHLMAPLERLHQVVKKSAIDWSAHTALPAVRADEIGDLTTSFAAVMRQLTERTAALQAARELAEDREKRIEAIANQVPDLVAYLDANERYVFVNLTYEKRFGVHASQIIGRSPRKLWGEKIYTEHMQSRLKAALSGQCITFDIESRDKADYHCFEVTYQPAWNGKGDTVVGIHSFARDVTHERQAMQYLEEKAQSDPLTGLLNRTGFDRRLASTMAQTDANQQTMALLLVDLDNFKQVNDTYGHAFGDTLLKIFAARLKACARDSDAVARVGGDEFAVILENIATTDAAERVARSIVTTTSDACIIDGYKIECSTSVGTANHQAGDQTTANDLFLKADTALYAAKRAGKGRFVVFGALHTSIMDTSLRRISD